MPSVCFHSALVGLSAHHSFSPVVPAPGSKLTRLDVFTCSRTPSFDVSPRIAPQAASTSVHAYTDTHSLGTTEAQDTGGLSRNPPCKPQPKGPPLANRNGKIKLTLLRWLCPTRLNNTSLYTLAQTLAFIYPTPIISQMKARRFREFNSPRATRPGAGQL